MLTLYVIFAIVGLAVFAISIFGIIEHDLDIGHIFDFSHFDMGHDFDIGHQDIEQHTDSPGLFSIRTISAFLAGFGVAGILAKLVLGWGMGGQLLLGFIFAFALAAIAYLIMKLMYSQQGGDVVDATKLVGKSGVITTPTTSDQGIGECRVDNRYYTCRVKGKSDVLVSGVLLINETVKVVESVEGMLLVEKL